VTEGFYVAGTRVPVVLSKPETQKLFVNLRDQEQKEARYELAERLQYGAGLRRICWRMERTCGRSRICWGMRILPRRRFICMWRQARMGWEWWVRWIGWRGKRVWLTI